MRSLDIGSLAARTGIPPSTLRYYDEIGLITSEWRKGLRRQFGQDALVRLALVQLGKAAGFSLTEIAAMIGPDGRPTLPRDTLRARAEALDHQIRNLIALRDTLRHVADCRAPSHLECPSFQRLLRIAARRGLRLGRRTEIVAKPQASHRARPRIRRQATDK